MKIVNVKKFIRTISILVILILIIILFSNKTYSKVDTKYKEESIILGDTLWSISQEEAKNNKYFENKMSPALSMFNHIYKEFNDIYHEATLKMGLSDSAFDILYSIVDLGDGCSQSDICKYSCLSKQTVNSSIKKMANLNYLTFKPGKGRVMQIFLTDKGRHLLDEKIYPIIKKENEAFLCMTDEECRLMLELYEKYNNALKNKFKEL